MPNKLEKAKQKLKKALDKLEAAIDSKVQQMQALREENHYLKLRLDGMEGANILDMPNAPSEPVEEMEIKAKDNLSITLKDLKKLINED